VLVAAGALLDAVRQGQCQREGGLKGLAPVQVFSRCGQLPPLMKSRTWKLLSSVDFQAEALGVSL
jgi:hypothetical protein